MQRIVSHPECSLEFYDADFYKSFRNGNLLHYAVLFARVSLNVMEYKVYKLITGLEDSTPSCMKMAVTNGVHHQLATLHRKLTLWKLYLKNLQCHGPL